MLDKFHSYLINTAHIREKYAPYYLRWVSECYTLLNEPLEHPINNDRKQEFLQYLSKNHEDWQIKQADYALRLYGFFLSREKIKPLEGSINVVKKWEITVEETRKALRFRHRSLRTEKTYLSWLRHFQGFVGEKPPHDLNGNDLQDFL